MTAPLARRSPSHRLAYGSAARWLAWRLASPSAPPRSARRVRTPRHPRQQTEPRRLFRQSKIASNSQRSNWLSRQRPFAVSVLTHAFTRGANRAVNRPVRYSERRNPRHKR